MLQEKTAGAVKKSEMSDDDLTKLYVVQRMAATCGNVPPWMRVIDFEHLSRAAQTSKEFRSRA